MDDDLWKPIDAATETRLFEVSVDMFTTSLADLDAFDLRIEIAHGLHASDGLRVDVIDADTLMVIGTDSMTTRGLYLATGRLLNMRRVHSAWQISRREPAFRGERMVDQLHECDDDLAWVRRRSDP
jgi:hypothetical protein